ncbi:MAG: murein hydrolase activator EnvC [Salinivirgaceae bacterium]
MKNLLLLLFICLLLFDGLAQTREELERQRQQTVKDIKFTNDLIEKTRRSKNATYNTVLLLNSRIQSRESIIKSINDEIAYLNQSILTHQELIYGLELDLDNLKKEYERIIYSSFKNKNTYDKMMFIFASEDFNTAFRRLKYYQQYTAYRKVQAQKIIDTKDRLSAEIIQLEILKADKKDLLLDKRLESQKLLAEKSDKDKEVKRLAGKEHELKLKLQKQQDLSNRLQKEITRIIEEEARKAAELLKKNNSDFFQLTPEEQLIADIFVRNKERLPWPTERGIVTGEFGEQNHPFLKGVKVRNDGIDIATTEGAIVRSIYEGTVSRVFSIPGAHKTVIIRHGNFLTVYSNLKEVTVSQGDKVQTKQTIGIVFTNKESESKTILQFQIWKEDVKMNPMEWLARSKNG